MVARDATSQFDEFAKECVGGNTVAHDGVQEPYASTNTDGFVQQEEEHSRVYYEAACP